MFGGDTFRSTRYCMTTPCTTANAPFVRFVQSVQPITYDDLSVRRRFTAGDTEIALTLGMQNIFDERLPSRSSGQFSRGAAAIGNYDLIGRPSNGAGLVLGPPRRRAAYKR